MDRLVRNRYPFTYFPSGWFFIANSSEINIEEVKPIFFLGQHLVLFRLETGIVQVFNAYCPHQGAHLGYGGKVFGDTLRCPYHGWGFDTKGNCISKPFNEPIYEDNRVLSWSVCEVDNKIFIYNTLDGSLPKFQISSLPEYNNSEWVKIQKRSWTFRSHAQEIAENLVDAAHFKILHKTSMPNTQFESNEQFANVYSQLKLSTKKGDVDASLKSIGYGLGYWVLHYSGIIETIVVATITPIDEEKIEFRFEFLVKGDLDLGKRFTDSIALEVEADIIIWENKIYRENPLLAPSDGPIESFRNWCKQFYFSKTTL